MTRESTPEVTCAHAAECPGCPLIGLPYAEQLGVKQLRVAKERAAYHETAAVPVGAPAPADPRASYRVRAKLVVSGPALGLFADSSHRVVDLPGCQVLRPEIATVAAAIRARLPASIPLRGVDLRAAGGGVLVTLIVADGASEGDVRAFAAGLLDTTTSVVGIFMARRDERSATVLGRAPSLLFGQARLERRLDGHAPFHFVTAGTFAQVHEGQERFIAREIAARLRSRFPGGASVLDLFSGVGASALLCSSLGHEVTAVEAYAPSAALCAAAAEQQGLRIRSITGDAAAVVRRFVTDGERFDAILVNPPRRGLSPELRADLARLAPDCLVYVSCEPRSLARDGSDLARRGLVAEQFSPVDMMPQSGDVETVAVFTRGVPPPPRVLYEDDRLLVVDKAAHEPTAGAGEEPTLLTRVRRLPGAADAVPLSRLAPGTSGLCAFALSPGSVEELRTLLAAAETEYTSLVRGIIRSKGTIRRSLGRGLSTHRGGDARTRYLRREVLGGHSLLTARMDEDHEHQLSRHFASLGHEIVGDTSSGHAPTNQFFRMRYLLDRPFVHCSVVRWQVGGETIEVEAPLPRDSAMVMDALRGARPGC